MSFDNFLRSISARERYEDEAAFRFLADWNSHVPSLVCQKIDNMYQLIVNGSSITTQHLVVEFRERKVTQGAYDSSVGDYSSTLSRHIIVTCTNEMTKKTVECTSGYWRDTGETEYDYKQHAEIVESPTTCSV